MFSRGVNSSQSATLKIAQAVEEENLTLRQVALRFATPRGDLVGTPEQIADKFELWLDSRASDGFVIGESLPGQFQLLVEQVIPLLQKRGIFRDDYEGATFRESLGSTSRPIVSRCRSPAAPSPEIAGHAGMKPSVAGLHQPIKVLAIALIGTINFTYAPKSVV
ncbi:hypothetical protein [Caulobacter sp. LjRoot300]|uniref:hypothetical protein n=1 Tax=Caulobacter sp. LjRoot300 TaxID=3342321 RepID=UPI003ECE8907